MRVRMVMALVLIAGCGDDDASPSGGSSGGSTTVASTSSAGTSTSTSASDSSSGTTGASSSEGSTSVGSSSGGSSSTGADACANGIQDADEADVDCGGPCGPCPTGSACQGPDDCETRTCETGSCLGPAEGCSPDDVQGAPGGMGWADSYSVDGNCYCASSFDHNIADIMVDTPVGPRTVFEVCEAIGPGPGIEGNPIYNDIQCGNGPANDAWDEDWCPGRVDQGERGCCIVGPTWDLSVLE